MSLQRSFVSSAPALLLSILLLAHPCRMFAQRGPGGGAVGGGSAGGGGLSGGHVGGATGGIDLKDELKDFHAALAVQATPPQISAYSSMIRTTEAASAQMRSFLEQLGQASKVAEIAPFAAALDQAIEEARTENKQFLDGFSDPQKSGLREISRKLLKDDSDLAQQAKALSLAVADTKAAIQPVSISAQSLDRALATFRAGQIDLGEEMSIGAANLGNDSTFTLAPVRTSVEVANQSITIDTSGVVSQNQADGDQTVFKLALAADLSDFQQNITPVLRGQLDKADSCGERVEIRSATLTPLDSASLLTVELHYERWSCRGGATFEMLEGNGTVELKLIPSVVQDGTLQLATEMGRVAAQGLLADSLRSGSLGDDLRDRAAGMLLSAARHGADFKSILPPAAAGHATLTRAHFEGTGMGRLALVLIGEIRVSSPDATALNVELKEKSSAR